ncbi:MAG: hypothetical protein R3266_02070 [Gemmatimonadota bacterium]|nr:hypothetical protein [Gemmatimonadota bacterium]
MKRWLRRVRGALGMGLTWGVTGFLIGIGIELIHNVWPNPVGSAFDIWPAVLAYPGFLGGVAFSTVLGIAGRHRRFAQLSLPRFAAWGAVGGLLVSLIPATMVALGLATPNVPLWQITAALAGPCALGGAVAASGSLVLARKAEDRALLEASDDLAGIGLTEEESQELLGES